MSILNMHCDFCSEGTYFCKIPNKDLFIIVYPQNIKYWVYKCDKCGAEVLKDVMPDNDSKKEI